MINKLTASALALMIKSGANKLSNNKAAVDALNVFPVPDGDTGTNMSLTFINAAKNISYEEESIDKLANSAASYTLRGARGNSGVILSQIMRGIATGAKGKKELSCKEFANCLNEGCQSAYRAVMKPTEGTILTVIKGCAKAAEGIETDDFVEFFRIVCEKGNETLSSTTDMLPALRQAGVVDAGGKGLMTIFEGMSEYLSSGNVVELVGGEEVAEKAPQATIKTEDIKFAYCTEFIIDKSSPAVKADKMKNAISKIGDSMVVIDDEDIIKVHIHTNNPGFVLEQAVRLGQLATVKIENMRLQHSNIVESAKEAKIEEEPAPSISPAPSEKCKNAVLAVAVGAGIEQIFSEMGAKIVPGGQTMNPSTEDILSAAKELNAENIYVLPNNSNIIMAAEQAAEIIDANMIVIPTKSIPQGISAIISYDMGGEPSDNETAMTRAASKVSTGLITHAVRETNIDGKEIHEGDVLGLVGKEIVSVGTDEEETAKDIIKKMVTEDSELITVYFGEGKDEKEANVLGEYIKTVYEDCDTAVYNGGQGVYSYIISVE